MRKNIGKAFSAILAAAMLMTSMPATAYAVTDPSQQSSTQQQDNPAATPTPTPAPADKSRGTADPKAQTTQTPTPAPALPQTTQTPAPASPQTTQTTPTPAPASPQTTQTTPTPAPTSPQTTPTPAVTDPKATATKGQTDATAANTAASKAGEEAANQKNLVETQSRNAAAAKTEAQTILDRAANQLAQYANDAQAAITKANNALKAAQEAAGAAKDKAAAAEAASDKAEKAAQEAAAAAEAAKNKTGLTESEKNAINAAAAAARQAADAAKQTATAAAAVAKQAAAEADEVEKTVKATIASLQKILDAKAEADKAEADKNAANKPTASGNSVSSNTADKDYIPADKIPGSNSSAIAGKDYVKDQLIYLYDKNDKTKPTPDEVAKAYTDAFKAAYPKETNFAITASTPQGVDGIAQLNIQGKYTVADVLNLPTVIGKDIKDVRLPGLYPNYYRSVCSAYGNDPLLNDKNTDYQWYHDRVYTKNVWPTIDQYNKSAVVALIDTGVNGSHEELTGHIADGISVQGGVVTQTNKSANNDTNGHGTSLAGIMAATGDNARGGRGIGANIITVMPVKVCSSEDTRLATDLDILTAMKYLAQKSNVDVINIGFGGYYKSLAYDTVINEVRNKGITIVAPAGNDGSTGDYFPASNDGVISVAALTIKVEDKKQDGKVVKDKDGNIVKVTTDLKAGYTNTGSKVDLCAPGGDGTYPITSTSNAGNDRYISSYGTSQAAAIVAATAALLKANNPSMHPDAVEDRLKSTARVIDSLKSAGMGKGCVDIAKALGIEKKEAKITAAPGNNTVLDKTKSTHTVSLTCSDTKAALYYDITTYSKETGYGETTESVKYDANKKIILKRENNEDQVAVHVVAMGVEEVILAEETFTYYYTPTASKITITSTNDLRGVAIGKTLNLKATIEPKLSKSNGVAWESSNTLVATIDSNGLITGKSEGIVTITARSKDEPDVTESVRIRVANRSTQIEMLGIPNATTDEAKQFSFDPINIDRYDTVVLTTQLNKTGIVKDEASSTDEALRTRIITLGVGVYPLYTTDAQGLPQSGALSTFTVESSDTKVVSLAKEKVDDERVEWKLKGLKTGEATITIKSLDGYNTTTSFKVKVGTPIKKVTIEDCGAIPGKTVTPKLTFPYYNGLNEKGEKVDEKITPDSTRMTYVIIGDSTNLVAGGKCDPKTGKFTVLSESQLKKKGITITKSTRIEMKVFSSTQNIDGTGYITLYPATKAINMNKELAKVAIPVGSTGNFFDPINFANSTARNVTLVTSVTPVDETSSAVIKPSLASPHFTFQTSDPKIIKFTNPMKDAKGKEIPTKSEDGIWEAVAPGQVTLTITTKDGTARKGELKLTVGDELGIAITNKTNRYGLYYGKNLTLNAVAVPSNQKLKRDKVEWYVDKSVLNGVTWYQRENDYLKITKSSKNTDGIIKLKSGSKNLTEPKKFTIYLDYTGYNEIKTVSAEITVYPAATEKITVENTKMTFSEIGERQQIVASSYPLATACQDYYSYKSSNTKVAKVYANGEVEAVGNGTATITVTAGDGSGKKTTCKAVVSQLTNVTAVYGKDNRNYVAMGGSRQMKAQFNKGAANKKVKWTIEYSDLDVEAKQCTIDQNGLLKINAKKIAKEDQTSEYTVIVRATPIKPRSEEYLDGGEAYAECEIKVYPRRTRMQKTGGTLRLEGDESAVVSFVEEKPEDKSEIAIWVNEGAVGQYKVRSSNSKVAEVSYTEGADGSISDFTVEGKGKGSATITVSAQDGSGKSVQIPVSVRKPVESITAYVRKTADGEYISATALAPGRSVKLYAAINDGAGASNTGVKWEFADTADKAYASFDAANTTVTAKRVTTPQVVQMIARSSSKEYADITSTPVDIMIFPSGVSKVTLLENGTEVKKTSICTGESVISANVSANRIDTYKITNKKTFDIRTTGKYADSVFSSDVKVKTDNAKIATAELVTNKDGSQSVEVTAGEKAGTANISVMAEDGSGKKANLKVTVVNPVRNLIVRSKNDSYNLAGGYSLKMQAVADEKASNKSVTWELQDIYGKPLDSSIAKIDSAGVLTAGAVAKKTDIVVIATSKDAAGARAARKVTLYKKSAGIGVQGNLTVDVKKSNEAIKIMPYEGSTDYCDRYKVTYKAGAGKVIYRTLPANEIGTGISAYGTKKGTIEVTATAMDGSGMKRTFKITVK